MSAPIGARPAGIGWRPWVALAGWSTALALTTAAYGALVGPLLRALFGGEALSWPAMLASVLPPPPEVATLRQGLPGLLVAVALLKGLAAQRHARQTARVGQRVAARLRARVFARLVRLPPDTALALGPGDALSRLTDDVETVERLVVEGQVSLLRDGAQVVALLTVCLVVEWRLALVVFGVYPLVFAPVARLTRRLRRHAGAAQAARAELAAVALDTYNRLPEIQLAAAERPAEARFAVATSALEELKVATASTRAWSGPINEGVGALALAATLAVAVQHIAAGTLAAEHVLSFFVSVLLLYQPVKGLVRALGVWAPGRAALDRIEALDRLPSLPASEVGEPPPVGAPGVVAEGLCLRRGARVVLNDLSFSVAAGEVVAVVGPNGAGKSSLLWALAGLLPVAGGALRIDGVAVGGLAPGAWRARVGWVTQGGLLGRGTLRDNLTLGRAIDPARLAAAAALTGLDRLAQRLPEGWETRLGDGGTSLSGGERQRLAFARALLADPALLVLDEPETHLDAEARAALATLLSSARAGRTVLLFTHDRSLAALADRAIVLPAPADTAPADTAPGQPETAPGQPETAPGQPETAPGQPVTAPPAGAER